MDRPTREAAGRERDAASASDESPYKGKLGVRRLVNAFRFSLNGIGSAFRHEDAFRQEALLAAVLIPVALWLESAVPRRR